MGFGHKWAYTTFCATVLLATSHAHAIQIGSSGEVDLSGSFSFDITSLALTLQFGTAVGTGGELQALDGSTPVPSSLVFNYDNVISQDGLENALGTTIELAYDRSQITGSPVPGTETGTLSLVLQDIVSAPVPIDVIFGAGGWLVELNFQLTDISAVPFYEDEILRITVQESSGLAPSPTTDTITGDFQATLSGSGTTLVSTDAPEAAPLALLAGGFAGLLIARRRR